jgi:hypothetical protein
MRPESTTHRLLTFCTPEKNTHNNMTGLSAKMQKKLTHSSMLPPTAVREWGAAEPQALLICQTSPGTKHLICPHEGVAPFSDYIQALVSSAAN